MPSEALAEQVEGERVDAGRGKAEDSGQQGDDEVGQRHIHLMVVERAVHVENVVGKPAQGEEADKHQDDLGQALPCFYLKQQIIQISRERFKRVNFSMKLRS